MRVATSGLSLVLLIALISLCAGCKPRPSYWWDAFYACNLSVHGWNLGASHSGFGNFTGKGVREVVFQDPNHMAVLDDDLSRVICESLHTPYGDQLAVWHDPRVGRDRWVVLQTVNEGFDLVLFGVERNDIANPSRIEELGRCPLERGLRSPEDILSRNRWIRSAGDALSQNVVVYVSGADHRGPGRVYVVDPVKMELQHDPIPVDANISDALYLAGGCLVLCDQVPDTIKGHVSCYSPAGVMTWQIVVGGFASSGRLFAVPGRAEMCVALVQHQNERDSLRSSLYVLEPRRKRVISRRDFLDTVGSLEVFGQSGSKGLQILAFPDSGGVLVLDSALALVRTRVMSGPFRDIPIPRFALDQPMRPVLRGSNEMAWLDRNGNIRSAAAIPLINHGTATPLSAAGASTGRWFLVGYGPQSPHAGMIIHATLTPLPPYRVIIILGVVSLSTLVAIVVIQQRRARGMRQYVAAFRALDEQGALGFSRHGKLLVCLGIAKQFCRYDAKRFHWHEVVQPQFSALARAVATLQNNESDFERSFILTDRNGEWTMIARGKLISDPRSHIRRILYMSPESGAWRRLKDETFSVLHDLKARLGTLARVFERDDTELARVSHVVPEIQEITESLAEVMKLGQILNPRQDPINLDQLVEAFISKLQASQPQVNWMADTRVPGVIYGDERLIKRLLSVLLCNAAEAVAGKENPHVRVIVENDFFRFDPTRPTAEQPAVVMEVADNGPGFPAGFPEGIFTRPVSSKGDHRGHGLIDVRKIVDAHSAEMVWSSTSSGVTFRIYFQQLSA